MRLRPHRAEPRQVSPAPHSRSNRRDYDSQNAEEWNDNDAECSNGGDMLGEEFDRGVYGRESVEVVTRLFPAARSRIAKKASAMLRR